MSRRLDFRTLDPSNPDDVELFRRVFRDAPGFTVAAGGRVPTDEDADRSLNLPAPSQGPGNELPMAIFLDGELVGCGKLLRGWPTPSWAFISTLVFRQQYQSHGLGPLALDKFEEIAEQWGCVGLSGDTDATNTRALKFQLREGFVPWSRGPSPDFVGEAISIVRFLKKRRRTR